MSDRSVHHMSAERKLAEHGVSITFKLIPSTTTTIKIKYDKGESAAAVFDGFPNTSRWLRLVITFVNRHCKFLSLNEIMECLHINRHWKNVHATATPIEILELHATLHAAGIDCGESP